MPSEAQIRELFDRPYGSAAPAAIATLRLAIAAERIADALERVLVIELAEDDAPAEPC